MGQSKHVESLLDDVVLLSSVVPASVTGEDKIHEFSNMDLAMKLHYIKAVYIFQGSETIKGLTISELKLPMFGLLDIYNVVTGRIRKHEDGRVFIKCNDSGVRIVEAKCTKTVDQFLDLALHDSVLNDQLVYNQVLGPDLGFSPLVLVQFTRFKCGGISVGVSWSHIIGDAFSASNFIHLWGQVLAGEATPKSLDPSAAKIMFNNIQSVKSKYIPFSLKLIDPVGDKWSIVNKCIMQKYIFHISSKQMDHLLSKITERSSSIHKVDPFQVISSVFWKSLAKVRGESEPKIVTICKKSRKDRKSALLSNSQMFSIVKLADSSRVAETGVLELAKILGDKSVDETTLIDELVGEHRKSDFIVYGTNLTFVNLEELNNNGLELKGNKPVFEYYSFSGVGDEGVVMVLPGTEKTTMIEDGNGRIVNVILPEDQLPGLKDELLKEWDIC